MNDTKETVKIPECAAYLAQSYDVIVVGAGHAGVEAALASARLGVNTAVFALNLDTVANMPCNPSIGGTAKGHLVREIDALGGEMGKAADKTFLQSRMLNRGKGPAVHSLRVQSDRRAYQAVMKHTIELTKNLDLKQAEITHIEINDGKVEGVVTAVGAYYPTKCVIIASGTYLKGKIIIGDHSYGGGPDGCQPANALSESLRASGVSIMRFKTGTPARVNRSTVDFSKMEVQEGDDPVVPMSFETKNPGKNTEVCHLTYTNAETHKVIMDNLHRSPLYSGKIEGVGPRYCPSIEDKIVRFKDKERHQLFIEPMGANTEEMYVQGMSSSLPEDVQIKMLRTIRGLENVKMMRTAYAIEYDCCDPTQLDASLEFKEIEGLYGAGQFNGSSGYEEAAAQGLIAGINAARKVKGEEPVVLDRSSSYIGTLIDDLVTKGTHEPYRMMTSRSEYRLLLRQDNADYRMTPLGHEIGLISDERYDEFCKKWKAINDEVERIEGIVLPPSEKVLEYLEKHNSTPISTGARFCELLRRPELDYLSLMELVGDEVTLDNQSAEEVEILVKYSGYIERQQKQVEQFKKLEAKKLPKDINYDEISGLRLEARQKLNKLKPLSIGQASRISGVSPADISVLLVYIEQSARKE